MKKINEVSQKVYGKRDEKILQVGEGNFLRAFADWMIDGANERGDYEGSIVLSAPIKGGGRIDALNASDGVYTLVMRGMENGKAVSKSKLISSVSRAIKIYENYDSFLELARSPKLEVIISNTTEAGIEYKKGEELKNSPDVTFPAKMTAFLYERFKTFGSDISKGILFLPVELIDRNGDMLKKYVLQYAADWALGDEFIKWIENANKFTNTLVDRIVTGYPKDQISDIEKELGYTDENLVTSELFNLWVIEGKKEWAKILPIDKGEANVIWTDDVTPYKTRKVRILNGAHTSTVPAAIINNHSFVLDFMNDPVFKKYLDSVLFDEVIPTLDLPKEELESFAKDVAGRFSNPYIKHALLDIGLNCCSKFNTRCVPSLLEYKKRKGSLPKLLTFSFAAFIKFYQGKMEDGKFMAQREDKSKYQIKDSDDVINFFNKLWQSNPDAKTAVKAILSNKVFWDNKDLSTVDGLVDEIAKNLEELNSKPVKTVIQNLTK